MSADVNRHKKGHSLVKRKKEPVHKLLKCVRPEMKKERVGVKTYLKRELAEVFRFASGFIAPTTATEVSPTVRAGSLRRQRQRKRQF